MKKTNDEGSVYPIVILIICLGVISFALLVAGEILHPFFNLMSSGIMKDFLLILWPYGIAFFMLIVLIFTTLMEMQKDKYKGR
jgi:hypothetical protein